MYCNSSIIFTNFCEIQKVGGDIVVLLRWCLYFFTFVFLMHVAAAIVNAACDVFKLKIGGLK